MRLKITLYFITLNLIISFIYAGDYRYILIYTTFTPHFKGKRRCINAI